MGTKDLLNGRKGARSMTIMSEFRRAPLRGRKGAVMIYRRLGRPKAGLTFFFRRNQTWNKSANRKEDGVANSFLFMLHLRRNDAHSRVLLSIKDFRRDMNHFLGKIEREGKMNPGEHER